MDFVSYRRYEQLACQDIHSWRLKQMHSPHVFEKAGFPVALESIDDLKFLLDTMHEGRIVAFCQELGGLGETDLETLRRVFGVYCDFFAHTFSSPRAIAPLGTLLAHHVIARKLAGYVTSTGIERPRILEYGPGCGYLSFFLHQWPNLGHYAQVEATPSFYVLQHWVNKFLWGSRFEERANPEHGCSADHPATACAERWQDLEAPLFVEARQEPTCAHYPWWRIGDLRAQKFDVVTSNANLNEFSRPAFEQYAQLAYEVMDDHGMFFAQCFGGGAQFGESFRDYIQRIFGFFRGLGFAPLAVHFGHQVQPDQRFMCLPNAVLVKPAHPLHGQCKQWTEVACWVDCSLTREMFRVNQPGSARSYSKDELLQAMLEAQWQRSLS